MDLVQDSVFKNFNIIKNISLKNKEINNLQDSLANFMYYINLDEGLEWNGKEFRNKKVRYYMKENGDIYPK